MSIQYHNIHFIVACVTIQHSNYYHSYTTENIKSLPTAHTSHVPVRRSQATMRSEGEMKYMHAATQQDPFTHAAKSYGLALTWEYENEAQHGV